MKISFYSDVKKFLLKVCIPGTIATIFCLVLILVINKIAPYISLDNVYRIIYIIVMLAAGLIFLIFIYVKLSNRRKGIEKQLDYYGEENVISHIKTSTIATFGNPKQPQVFFTKGLLIERGVILIEYENIDYVYMCVRTSRNCHSYYFMRIFLLNGKKFDICHDGNQAQITKCINICLEQNLKMREGFTMDNWRKNREIRKSYKDGTKQLSHIDLSQYEISQQDLAQNQNNTNQYQSNIIHISLREDDIYKFEKKIVNKETNTNSETKEKNRAETKAETKDKTRASTKASTKADTKVMIPDVKTTNDNKNIPNLLNQRMYMILSNATIQKVTECLEDGRGLGLGMLKLQYIQLEGFDNKVFVEIKKSPEMNYLKYYFETQNLLLWLTALSKEHFCFTVTECWRDIPYLSYPEPYNILEDSVTGIYKGRAFHYCIPGDKYTTGKRGQFSIRSFCRSKFNFDIYKVKGIYEADWTYDTW